MKKAIRIVWTVAFALFMFGLGIFLSLGNAGVDLVKTFLLQWIDKMENLLSFL